MMWSTAMGCALLFLASSALADTELRVATYHIRFLDADDLPRQGDRKEKLKKVLEELAADVVALQGVKDRRALQALFRQDNWHLIIDDDSANNQNVALAVREPLEVPRFGTQIPSASDEDYLFERDDDTGQVGARRW